MNYAVGEMKLRAAGDQASFLKDRKVGVERDPPESHDHPDLAKQINLPLQILAAIAELFGPRLVARRSAAGRGGNVRPVQAQAIVPGDGLGLV